MSNFSYTAVTAEGKSVKGKLKASSKEHATIIIKDMKLIPMTVEEEKKSQNSLVIGNPVKTKDLVIFCQQFEAILTAGVSVLEALYLLREQTENKYFAEVISDIYTRVERGESLADSMIANNKYFPSILINMVASGEASGSLETSLHRMAEHFENEQELKQSVKKATTYPIIVALIAIIVVVILLVVVVPTFVGMFASMGVELPVTTRALLAMSAFMTNWWYVLIAGTAAMVILMKVYLKTDDGAMAFNRFVLKVPILGPVQTKIVSSRFARTLSTLLASGLPLLEALIIVSKVVDNKFVEKGLIDAHDQVSKGVALSVPVKELEVFPPMITHMVTIGEETGQLEPILDKVADFYDKEVESAVAQLTTMLEPAIIVFLAVVVGFVVLSVIQPMFGMYAAMEQL